MLHADRHIRIAYCIDSMALGGTEKQLVALIAGLDRERFTPILCTFRPSSMPLREITCQVHELALESLASPSALVCIRRLRRFFKQQRVDIVQTFFRDSTLVGLCSSLGTGVRARIASFRDLGFWRTPRNAWPLRLAYRHFDGFIANAKSVAAQVHALDGIPFAKIEIIYNGVRMPSTVNAWKGSRDHMVVGIVANLNRMVKRVDLFIGAAAIVRRRFPATRFVIVGDGPLRPDLLSLATRLGIADVIDFVGSAVDIQQHLGSFDIGVLSSDSEGLSNAILEYMAAGLPTVARRVGGNEELIVPHETGILVDDHDAAGLANGIGRLIENPALARDMGARARVIAAQRFGMMEYVRNHEAYYLRVVGAR